MAGKIFLIHWNAAEVDEYARSLEDTDWQVEWEAEDGARAVKAIRENPPDVIIIYLTRLPSHGRETADYLRSLKSTRHLPIIFVGGAGEALERTKAKLPEAIYTTPGELEEALSHIK